ncbi:stalk domain-containing protein [Paenibacillus rigui]|nr:stalk domain-containing protein [Paenibacillus rigui]
MNKFILGLSLGVLLSISGAAVFASETVQSLLVPVTFEKNGKPVATDPEYGVLNYNGHVYVPVRFVAQAFGAAIGYDAEQQRVIMKDRFSDDLDLFDPKYRGVMAGNLIVTKEGDHTKVAGQLQMTQPSIRTNSVEGRLTFYDEQGKLIGEAAFQGDAFGSEPVAFEAAGAGHFNQYASVKLDIRKVNLRPIIADPDPSEPELALNQIFQIDWNQVNQIEIVEPGGKTVTMESGHLFQEAIQHLQAVNIRKKVDPSVPVGYAYTIHLYAGDTRYTYLATGHLYNNQQINYGMFFLNDSTRALDQYVESVLK